MRRIGTRRRRALVVAALVVVALGVPSVLAASGRNGSPAPTLTTSTLPPAFARSADQNFAGSTNQKVDPSKCVMVKSAEEERAILADVENKAKAAQAAKASAARAAGDLAGEARAKAESIYPLFGPCTVTP